MDQNKASMVIWYRLERDHGNTFFFVFLRTCTVWFEVCYLGRVNWRIGSGMSSCQRSRQVVADDWMMTQLRWISQRCRYSSGGTSSGYSPTAWISSPVCLLLLLHCPLWNKKRTQTISSESVGTFGLHGPMDATRSGAYIPLPRRRKELRRGDFETSSMTQDHSWPSRWPIVSWPHCFGSETHILRHTPIGIRLHKHSEEKKKRKSKNGGSS